MKTFMDDVAYNEKGNRVTMRKRARNRIEYADAGRG
jgi:hypothetical protein